GERCYRHAESEKNSQWQCEPDQELQNGNKLYQPISTGADEEQIRDQAVEDNDDENDRDSGLRNLTAGPVDLHEYRIADDERDQRGQELREQLHGERGTCRTHSQFRLNSQLVRLNVLFEFARENLSLFGVESLDIGDERQHGGEDDESDDDGYQHRTLLNVGRACPADLNTEDTEGIEAESLPLSISPVGSLNLARSFCSKAAISPWSDSWSWPARWSKPWSMRTL